MEEQMTALHAARQERKGKLSHCSKLHVIFPTMITCIEKKMEISGNSRSINMYIQGRKDILLVSIYVHTYNCYCIYPQIKILVIVSCIIHSNMWVLIHYLNKGLHMAAQYTFSSVFYLINFIYDSCSEIMSTCVRAPYSTLFLIISGCVLWWWL